MTPLRFICGAFLAVLFPALSVTAQQPAGQPKPAINAFPPRDEATYDQSWTRFRDQLIEALQKRDLKFVMSVVDPNVRNGTERPNGHQEFRRQWHVDEHKSPLWRELPRALYLGAAYYSHSRMPRSLCAPYVLPHWPRQVDPHAYGAITARETSLREKPSGASTILSEIGYAIVRVSDWEVEDADAEIKQKWVKIRVEENEGFIPEEHIRSPIEHLACFRKGEAGWRLTSFLAAGE